jgi:hypothetical protein
MGLDKCFGRCRFPPCGGAALTWKDAEFNAFKKVAQEELRVDKKG